MKVIKIIDGTTVDGPGFRTSIYFAGCHHHCPGCHNPSTWDMANGEDMSIEELTKRVVLNNMPVTFSGGDPLYQCSDLLQLAKAVKERGINIWCYTGFTYDEIIANPAYNKLLDYMDVIVDGPYIESLRDTSLLFRGSKNQRLIDVRKSTSDNITEWTSDF
ncbi:MAG: anaerobic ribonucleoside-triphosphate reductase activating protein [Paramuribaculum sp.]|nr:anaerobic ribonucleoside-triphosphate reductase activating protein [Paramuribaculum sp.]